MDQVSCTWYDKGRVSGSLAHYVVTHSQDVWTWSFWYAISMLVFGVLLYARFRPWCRKRVISRAHRHQPGISEHISINVDRPLTAEEVQKEEEKSRNARYHEDRWSTIPWHKRRRLLQKFVTVIENIRSYILEKSFPVSKRTLQHHTTIIIHR